MTSNSGTRVWALKTSLASITSICTRQCLVNSLRNSPPEIFQPRMVVHADYPWTHSSNKLNLSWSLAWSLKDLDEVIPEAACFQAKLEWGVLWQQVMVKTTNADDKNRRHKKQTTRNCKSIKTKLNEGENLKSQTAKFDGRYPSKTIMKDVLSYKFQPFSFPIL